MKLRGLAAARSMALLLGLLLALVPVATAVADDQHANAPGAAFDLPDIETTPTPTPSPTVLSLGTEVEHGDATRPAIALTFDAGAGAGPAPQLLQILRDKQVRSTFFITGVWARQNPLLVRQIAQDGHEIGNHTWDHRDLATLSNAEVQTEIVRADDLLSSLTGKPTKPLFRYPYGSRNPRLQAVIGNLGYRSIYWTVDSLDWMDQATVSSITNRLLNGAANGAIMLMHVGATYTTAALPNLIDTLRSRGYRLETVTSVAQ